MAQGQREQAIAGRKTRGQPRRRAPTAEFDFKVFFAVWAQQQGWCIPQLHLLILQFLDNSSSWNDGQAVLQVFRNAGKSTILALLITYLLVKDPTLRILVQSADHDTAVKIVRDVSNVIANHPLAKHLRGKDNMWREDQFWVTGSDDPRNPSCWCKGILSNVTGSRCDWLIFDDVEVPKNAHNERLRDMLRTRIAEAHNLLNPGGRTLFVGTPHSFDSIYPEQIDKGSSSLKIPLLTETAGEFPTLTGISAWPERFPLQEILKKQRTSKSRAEFMSQQQLIPMNADDVFFDAANLIEYRSEIDYYTANGETVLSIGGKRMVSCSCIWDPATNRKNSDDSVLAIVFTTMDGHYYVHRTFRLTGEAEEQCSQVVGYAKEFKVPQVTIEDNGVGAFLPALLRKSAADSGIAVVGRHSSIAKVKKIIEGIEVRLSAQVIHCHSSVMSSPFFVQLRDFNPKLHVTQGSAATKDDYIDAVATAILNEPIRITKGVSSGKRNMNWTGTAGEHEMALDGFSF
ncbi:phage terminase large subunit [Uliginosibacterium sp. 31-16]|uniref:phage terminase large subunit n=1 Tax=Uliginosibacterium sp. 31-16 TaxID=3068315 RepID=UPI00273ECA1B|nr:phage terminase large subunit [Uliginosibacterium sp. 31-16]MDP5239934.1 phage terminase large subunit [Uliginosibacterium sp. 31-16]